MHFGAHVYKGFYQIAKKESKKKSDIEDIRFLLNIFFNLALEGNPKLNYKDFHLVKGLLVLTGKGNLIKIKVSSRQ